MNDLTAARAAEHAKYERAYGMNARYRMKADRRALSAREIGRLDRGSYLDVACGQGDMLADAERMGFGPVQGTEIVPALIGGKVVRAEVHALPFADKSFDVVSMFDAIEHLLPGDDYAACRELARVARRHVLITANNHPSFNKAGDDLHINKRPYHEWDRLFRCWFRGKVSRLSWPLKSECWRVDL
jgi:ubiquinone/menaquinone biosynthesis C-methylase UbiE